MSLLARRCVCHLAGRVGRGQKRHAFVNIHGKLKEPPVVYEI